MAVPAETDIGPRDAYWTEEDYLRLPEDRWRVELIDGSLLVSPSPAGLHQRLETRLWHAIDAAAPNNFEVLTTINVRVASGRILIPDLAVVTNPGSEQLVWDAPDVAMIIEIESPSSVAMDRAIKPPLYAAAGIPRYLRIELAEQGAAAVQYTLVGGRYEAVVETAVGEMLRLVEPFAAELDLTALSRQTRRQS